MLMSYTLGSRTCKLNQNIIIDISLQFHSNLGYKRDDPSTVHHSKLPVISEKGMCMAYGVAHEDFVWRIRAEPGVVEAFETVYDTKDIM